MTIDFKLPFATAYGSGRNDYTFDFPYKLQSDIKVFLTKNGVRTPLVLGLDYTIENGFFDEGLYRDGKIVLKNPLPTSDFIQMLRFIQPSQPLNYIDLLNNQPASLEKILDLITLYVLDTLASLQMSKDDASTIKYVPDPTNQSVNRLVITAGDNTYKLSTPWEQPTASTPEGSILKYLFGEVRFAPDTGSSNPPIPATNPTSIPRCLISVNSVYLLGDKYEPVSSAESNIIHVWDGPTETWKKVQATGISNPVIPNVGSGTLIRNANASPEYQLLDDSYKGAAVSNCVISGCNFTIISPTVIQVSPAVYYFFDTPNSIPTVVTMIQTSLTLTFTSSRITYLYFNKDGTYSFSGSKNVTTYGPSMLVATIEHPNNNAITYIKPAYIFMPKIISSFARYLEATINRVSSDLIFSINTTTRVMSYTGGLFTGYNSNINVSSDSPHTRPIAASSNITYNIRNGDDSLTANLTAFSLTESYESAPGVFTPLPNNNAAYFPIFIYPDGKVQIQRPTDIYSTANTPTLDTWLDSFKMNPILRENACMCAVILLRSGQAFGTGANNSQLINITNFGVGANVTPPAGSNLVPPFIAGQAGQNVVVGGGGVGIAASGYSIPTPAINDSNLAYVSNNGSITKVNVDTLVKQEPRVFLSNGVITGMNIAQGVVPTLTVSTGSYLLVNDNEGVPSSINTYNFIGTNSFALPTNVVGSRFLNINAAGVLTLSTTRSVSPRGPLLTLAKITLQTGGIVTRVQFLYPIIQNIINQLNTFFESTGNTISGQVLSTNSIASISVSSGTMTGFNINAGLSKASPHSVLTPAIGLCKISFFTIDGAETTQTTALPLVLQSELTPNVLANLPVNKIGFYPVYLFKDGSLGIQYTQQLYDTYTEKSLEEWHATYIFSPLLNQEAALIAVLKYRQGANFLTGNSLDQNIQNFGTSSTTRELPANVAGDEGKLLVVDLEGKPEWGVRLELPPLTEDFNGLSLIYGFGNNIQAGYPKVEPINNKIEINPAGADNNKLMQINSQTDYFTPSIWTSNINCNVVQPALISRVFKGISLQEFSINNGPDGSVEKFVKAEEIIINPPITRQLPPQSIYTIPQILNVFNKFSESFDTIIGTKTYANYGGIASADSGNNKALTFPPNGLINLTNGSDGAINLNFDFSSPAPRLILQSVLKKNLYYEGFFGNTLFDFSNVPQPWTATLDVDIPKILYKGSNSIKSIATGVLNNIYQFFLAPSDTPQNKDSNRITIVINTNEPVDRTEIINFKKTYTFSSASTTYHYGTLATDNDYLSSKIAIGLGIWGIDDTGYVTFNSDINRSFLFPDSKVTLTVKTVSSVASRFELGNIAAKTTYTGTGGRTALKAGVIRIYYQLLNFDKVVSNSLAGSRPNLLGLILDPFNSGILPEIRLENQTGSAAPTEFITAEPCHVKDPSFCVYDLAVTQNQLDNWKIVVRFKNTEVNIKTLLDELGATLFFVNLDEA